MRTGVASTSQAISTLHLGLAALVGLVAVSGVQALGNMGSAAVQAADDFSLLQARLGLVARDGATGAQILDGIAEAAQRAQTPTLELAEIYQRQANAIKDLGLSQSEGIRIAETLAKVTKISGVASSEASAAMLQLSQALASGRFQGESLGKLPEIMRILQRETGKTAGELRKLASEGKLTGETLTSALLNAGAEVDQKFSQVPRTSASAFALLQDQVSRTFGAVAQQAGVSQAFADLWDQIRAGFASPAGQAAFRVTADLLAGIARGAGVLAAIMGESRIAYLAFVDAITNTTAFQALASAIRFLHGTMRDLWQFMSGVAVQAAQSDLAAPVRDFIGEVDAALSRTRALDALRQSIDPDARAPVRAAANPTTRRPVRLGSGNDGDMQKRLIENTQRAIALERLRGDLLEANAEHDVVRARALENELSVRNRVSAQLQREQPQLAAVLATEIRRTEELQRQKRVQDDLQAKGVELAKTITDGFRDGVREGQKFTDVLKDIASRLVEQTAQWAILGPLQQSFGRSFGASLSGVGVTNGNDPFSLGGLLGSIFSGVASGGVGLAKGGVLTAPVALAGSGGFRGVAGEAGPEAILPLRRGPDGSLGVQAGGGSAPMVIHVPITVQGDATAETVEKLRRVAREEIGRAAPGIVRTSVGAVSDTHRRDANYLRR